MKFLVIGESFYDINIPIEKDLENNLNTTFSKYEKVEGGFPLTAARVLSNLGSEVSVASVVGNDTFGKNITVTLKNADVNIDNLEIDYENDTLVRYNFINIKNKTKTTFKFVPKDLLIKKPKYAITPNVIITDVTDLNATNIAFNQFNSAIRVLNAYEVNDNILKLAKISHYMIVSQEFAEKFSNSTFNYNDNSSFVKIYQFLKDSFKANVIVTLKNGGVLYSLDNQVKIAPNIKVNSVDLTSAHDIFVAAFAYYVGFNKPLEETIKLANIISSLSTTKFGTTNSAPTKTEIQDFLNPPKPPQININQNGSAKPNATQKTQAETNK